MVVPAHGHIKHSPLQLLPISTYLFLFIPMNFSPFFVFSFLALIVPTYAVPTPVKSGGVYVPKILTPRGNEVWIVGHDYTVTWYVSFKLLYGLHTYFLPVRDVTDSVPQMTNPRGFIRLRKGNVTLDGNTTILQLD
jgi:hypothetical protein